ncbi:hypothetical protein B9G69_014065 [Bdellovibrio sp. SKB1291214]|uniref:hypothetical protein n=1 Tax=Bdellovibrio sp. SKB1291214 TaxID=1732569 RepID=UPI00223F32F6|nr:hypothetical protein [Bdellovibrio sp. SKB1291214]UYL08173.1 hypothetical protein B9G69_014065 [Bdellovibrio sp. SKB1291214]
MTAVLPIPAYATLSCDNVFAEEIETVPRVFYKRLISKSLLEASANTELIKANIAKLASAVLHENSAVIKNGRAYNSVPMTDFVVQEVKLIPGQYVDGYALFIVKLRSQRDGDVEFERIRSNGYAAFIERSFQFRQDLASQEPPAKRFKAAFLENETVKMIDQGEVFISSLPDQINLSRVMNQAEREQWVEDKPLRTGPFGARTHFAVNYFKFQKQEPYLIPYSKQQLLKAYRNGDVEINTYDSIPHHEMWHGKIDLEFEVVFTGIKAMESLRPLLKNGLRQDILKFE